MELRSKVRRDAGDSHVADAPPLVPAGAAIDRGHLARMTHGERELGREVLALFATQSDLLLGRMRGAEPAVVRALAHTLIGSARGIGAWIVAETAEQVEAEAGPGKDTAAAVLRLEAAVREAQREIAEILRG